MLLASIYAIAGARHALPTRKHVLLHGFPSDEGNIVEAARAFAHSGFTRIYWSLAPSDSYLNRVDIDPRSVRRLPGPRHPKTMWAFVTAACVLTSHGMYGMSTPPKRKPHIDLWHGEQTKGGPQLYPFRPGRGPSSTRLLCSTSALAEDKASRAQMTRDRVMYLPQPRVDQFSQHLNDDVLRTLGIDPRTPFVVWMPTFRRALLPRSGTLWSDTSDSESDRSLSRKFEAEVAAPLAAAGIQVVVKPHIVDVETRIVTGAITVTNKVLHDAETPLYRLLGRSAGLITDYSSVWVDYLHTNRPIGLFLPDVDAYEIGRGVLPSAVGVTKPGVILSSPDRVEEFVAQLHGRTSTGFQQREECREVLGLASGRSAGRRLVQYLEEENLLTRLERDPDRMHDRADEGEIIGANVAE